MIRSRAPNGYPMTRQLAKSEPLLTRFGDVFVILSATLLSLASGAWLISRLGLELSSALLSALAIYCSLLLFHLLVRRSFKDGAEEPERYDHGDDGDHWHTDASGERFEIHACDERGGYADAGIARARRGSAPGRARSVARAVTVAVPMQQGGAEEDQAPAGADDPFTFRTLALTLLRGRARRRKARLLGDAPEAAAEPGAADAQPEMNVELIQELIKKLADELNGGPPARRRRARGRAGR